VIDHLAAHGLADTTLRQLGAAIGSSHRMLLYHFGSREGLLIEVVRAVEERQRAALAADLAAVGDDVADAARRMWKRLSAPALEANERLFFELYGRALGGDAGAAPLLDGIVDDWIEPLLERLKQTNASFRRDELRLGIAVVRGLLLDLLATGDRRATTRALNIFLERYAQDAPG
jgi:AcrR family transcriptional regulator